MYLLRTGNAIYNFALAVTKIHKNSQKFLEKFGDQEILLVLTHNTGDGTVNWGENSLDFAISDGTFSIDLNSPFIPDNQRGTLLLKVQGGIITDSQDSGIFDGYLPQIGSSGTFSVSGSNFKPQLSFDYNLGDFGKEVDLEITADGGAIPVPESSTMNPLSLGVLGLIFLGGKRFWRSSSKK